MSIHTDAVTRLSGAVAAHTLTATQATLVEIALRRHGPDDCAGIRHILGRPECETYRAALAVLGLGAA
jgi:hypothetical protein